MKTLVSGTSLSMWSVPVVGAAGVAGCGDGAATGAAVFGVAAGLERSAGVGIGAGAAGDDGAAAAAAGGGGEG
ncbi:MAG TPA: hypothetical protein VLT86_03910 [Vicinamibacterales bacterium]|nr:hypothetical protein [Vicinamibacterales bacterium]